MESLVAPLFNSNIGDKSLISRAAILTGILAELTRERAVDEQVSVGEDVIRFWVFSIN
jgi:hypothetical protein